MRTARFDLDDYNKEVDEGLHITSMAGTWMSVVEGFAGVRVNEKGLFVNPMIKGAFRLPGEITMCLNSFALQSWITYCAKVCFG